MAQTFFIPGPLPGMNEIIAAAKGCKGRGTMYSKMKREWNRKVAEVVIGDLIRPVSRVLMRIEWHEAGRRRDPDNISAAKKFILDGLVQAGVMDDDGWAQVAAFEESWVVNSDAPGAWVSLIEVSQ